MNSDQPFSHALSPCKTLWFEFLLTPDLLYKHLNQRNPDPNPIELIISFLNNISSGNGSANSSTTPTNSSQPNQGNEENVNSNMNNGSNTSSNCVQVNTNNNQLNSNQDGSNSSSIENGINLNSKKYLGIRLLALKVTAFLKYDLETLEQHLPITMQYTLLNELIKICDNNSASNCSLFAYINYYRWILRSVIKLSYPSRKSYSIPIPLLQQIGNLSALNKFNSKLIFKFFFYSSLDPCYLPHETIENWFRKLRDLSTTAVNGLEKVIKENELKEITNILMPTFDCFKELDEELNEINFDWQKVTKLNTNEIMDTIKFELGKWFFFNENYLKASSYFNKITLNKDKFENLEEFKESSNEMLDDKNKQLNDLVNDLNGVNMNDCLDLSRFNQKKEQKTLFNQLRIKFEEANDQESEINLKTFAYYLSLKLPNCSNELLKFTGSLDEERMDCLKVTKKVSSNNKYKQDIFQNDLEFKLIEATEPGLILDLINKINRSPQEINKLWELPKIYIICLKNIKNLTTVQQQRCFFILAKAFELRNAKYYSESRTLLLSLFEDVQTNMQPVAELITYEILLTDLEIQTESKDKDERIIEELIKKCKDVLEKEETISDILPQLMQHCCIFLLEYDVPILENYLQSSNQLIKITSSLYCIKNLKNNLANFANELWDTILNVFLDDSRSNQNQSSKRRKLQGPKLNILTIDLLISYVNNLKSLDYICILTSCLSKIHNLIKDNQGIELSMFSPILWPNTVGVNASSIDLNRVSLVLKLLLNKALKQSPNDIKYIKCKAELALVENQFHESLRNFIKILIIQTDYFSVFKLFENESIIQKMIICSVKLGCFTQAAVLHQMTKEINYQLVFKALSEKICYDSCDDLYVCIWDLTILEFLVNMHYKRGELDRKTKVVRMIGQLELNANNAEEIRKEASNVRRGKFFRYMAKKYL